MAMFPVFKLMVLASRSLSRPVSQYLKKKGKLSRQFRKTVLVPPAQLYHWAEVRIRMRMMNLGSPTDVPKLNENMAIELGADILGEAVVFTVASACLLLEFLRQSANEKEKEKEKSRRLNELENRLYELEFIVTEQEARLRQVARKQFPGLKAAWKSPLASAKPSVTSQPTSEKQPSSSDGGSGDIADKKKLLEEEPEGILGRTLNGLISAFKPK